MTYARDRGDRCGVRPRCQPTCREWRYRVPAKLGRLSGRFRERGVLGGGTERSLAVSPARREPVDNGKQHQDGHGPGPVDQDHGRTGLGQTSDQIADQHQAKARYPVGENSTEQEHD
jgi:hypothetical protein